MNKYICDNCGLELKECLAIIGGCPLGVRHVVGDTHFCDIAKAIDMGEEAPTKVDLTRLAKLGIRRGHIL